MSTSVYLADLRHDFRGIVANDCMPLGVGCMKAVMDRDPDTDSYRLQEAETFEFRLSDDSAQALEKAFELWSDRWNGLTKMVARLQVGTQNREACAAAACGAGA